MKVEIVGKSAFGSCRVLLEPGEEFLCESDRMVSMSAGLKYDITTRRKGGGGMLGVLKRLVGGDSLFLTTFQAVSEPGEVVLAPYLMGEVHSFELAAGEEWFTTGGSFMGCGSGVHFEPVWQGVKGIFSGESLFFLKMQGEGPVVVSAFGAIRRMDVDGELIVDTGHVVAFETSLDYEITKAGTSWLHSFLAGEGLVMRFKGKGRLLLQSHNATSFGMFLGPKLPERSA